jgi:molybdenum cofactor cytidylyltransferase
MGRNGAPVYGVILAAGSSTRFGGADKLSARIGDSTVLALTTAAYVEGTKRTFVVLKAGDESSVEQIRSPFVELIWNSASTEGQSVSLRLGVAALPPDAAAAVIGVADQPLLSAEIVRTLIDSWLREPISAVVPLFRGARGNPVLFSREVFPKLLEVTGDVGGRHVLSRIPVRELEMPDWWRGMDIDTPGSLALANEYLEYPQGR